MYKILNKSLIRSSLKSLKTFMFDTWLDRSFNVDIRLELHIRLNKLQHHAHFIVPIFCLHAE